MIGMKNELAYFPVTRMSKRYNFLTEDFLFPTEKQKGSLQIYSREISENIGQMLSLARFQLSGLPVNGEYPGKLTCSSKPVGQVIAKLAELEKQLSFEDVVSNAFANSLITVLKRLFETGFCVPRYSESGKTVKLNSVKELVVFCILQQLIYPVLNVHEPGLIVLDIRYQADKVEIEILRQLGKRALILDIGELVKLKQRLKPAGGTIRYKGEQWHILKMVINS